MSIKINKKILEELRREDGSIQNVQEMKDSYKHIMSMYIDQKSKYGVNISAIIKRDINARYNEMMERRLSYISLTPITTGSSVELISKQNIMEDEIKTKEYVRDYINLFDDAMEGIITLLRLDSLSRFYDTKEYKTWSFALDDKNKKYNKGGSSRNGTPISIGNSSPVPTGNVSPSINV